MLCRFRRVVAKSNSACSAYPSRSKCSRTNRAMRVDFLNPRSRQYELNRASSRSVSRTLIRCMVGSGLRQHAIVLKRYAGFHKNAHCYALLHTLLRRGLRSCAALRDGRDQSFIDPVTRWRLARRPPLALRSRRPQVSGPRVNTIRRTSPANPMDRLIEIHLASMGFPRRINGVQGVKQFAT